MNQSSRPRHRASGFNEAALPAADGSVEVFPTGTVQLTPDSNISNNGNSALHVYVWSLRTRRSLGTAQLTDIVMLSKAASSPVAHYTQSKRSLYNSPSWR